MIFIHEKAPRWLRELGRFLPLKSLLFIHGNILDLVTFPVKQGAAEEVFWTDDDLASFLLRFLRECGYQVVGLLDPVDGLSFPELEMSGLFKKLEKGERPTPEDMDLAKKSPGHSGYSAAPGGITPRPPSPEPKGSSPHPLPFDMNKTLDAVRRAVRNTDLPVAFVMNLASRFLTSPQTIIRDERTLFTKILKASLECADVYLQNGAHHKNILILVCDRINDLPPFLYVNNPRARAILIDKPDSNDRARFLKRTYRAFHGGNDVEPSPDLTAKFTALTSGFANYELNSLVHLSRRETISIKNVQHICHRYKYGFQESEWDKLDRARLQDAEAFIRSRIKGQDGAVARLMDIIKRARVGLAAGKQVTSNRPRGVLFLAGPTGVGKTEMAKALAELLFGEADRCLRFDMSEYSAPQSDEKLLGAPPGYVGYEEGGQLTNAIKEKPFAILLFDEIEKAHGSIFDKFLQILDDGRLTDGKGETYYFSETIIIFTSNLGTVFKEEGAMGSKTLVTPDLPFPEMRDIVLETIRDHFNYALGRPEILNRFGDNFVVLDFIKPPVDEEILDMLLEQLIRSASAKWKIDLIVHSPVRDTLIGLARQNLHHGGRGIRNVVDSALVNPLNRFLFDYVNPDPGQPDLEPGATVNVHNLIDHGPEAAYRFQVQAELTA